MTTEDVPNSNLQAGASQLNGLRVFVSVREHLTDEGKGSTHHFTTGGDLLSAGQAGGYNDLYQTVMFWMLPQI